MRLAFSTLPCESWAFDKVLDICTDNEINALELRLGPDEWSCEDMSEKYAREMKESLDKRRIRVSNIGSEVLIRNYDIDRIEQYKRSLRLAKLLDAKGVRIFLGNFIKNYTDKREPIDYSGLVKCVKKMANISSCEGIEVWIETHNEFATGRSLKKLICDVNMPNCKVIWDIIHPIEQNETVDETINAIWASVAHFHIKDGIAPADKDKVDWEYTKLGEGSLPIIEIIGKALKLGFAGYFSLEWESKWHKEISTPDCVGELIIPQFAQYIKQMR